MLLSAYGAFIISFLKSYDKENNRDPLNILFSLLAIVLQLCWEVTWQFSGTLFQNRKWFAVYSLKTARSPLELLNVA